MRGAEEGRNDARAFLSPDVALPEETQAAV